MKFCAALLLGSSLLVSNTHASIEVSSELLLAVGKKEAGDEGSKEEKKEEKKPASPNRAPAAGAAGAAPKPVVQEKYLKITVRSSNNKPESGLVVRYWFISRDMKTMKPSILDGGEANTELKPGGTNVITSDSVKASYTQKPIYFAVTPAAGAGAGAKGAAPKGGAGAPGAKPAEAGGTKIVGYGAQVISKDGKVVAESFSEPSYKVIVGSEGTKPGPLFKAQKDDAAK